MARIEIPTPDDVAAAQDSFAAAVTSALQQVADRAAQTLGTDIITAATVTGPPGPGEPIPPPAQETAAVDDISIIPALWTVQVTVTLMPELETVYQVSGAHVYAAIADLFPDLSDIPAVSSFVAAEQRLAGAQNRLVGIGDMLWENVRDELLIGFAAGEDIGQLRDRVRAAAAVSMPRAERIARTEVISASNAGSIDQVRAAGLVGTKEWLDTPDERTRCTHHQAGGQVVALEDTFQLGGGGPDSACPDIGISWADYPGDPTLPAAEAVNCRCGIAFDVDVAPLTADGNMNAQSLNFHLSGGASMPWHIVEDSAQCPTARPYAVVKDATGQIEGCHPSRSAATEHMQALYAAEQAAAEMPCPPGHHRMPDGMCMPDEDMNPDYTANSEPAPVQRWEGTLVIEGAETGDGRMFNLGSLTWRDLPIPLMYQKVTSHGGIDDVTVNVGAIDEIWRDGNLVWGRGRIDMADPNGIEVARKMREGYLRGVSIDADSIKDADVTYVWPARPLDNDPADDFIYDLFATPELTIFNKGRISAATVVNIPAFQEAKLFLIDADTGALIAAGSQPDDLQPFAAVRTHNTATTDEPWEIAVNEKRLPSPMAVATGRDFYAWIDDTEVSAGKMPKSAGKFGHHMVNADGTPGAANLTACSAGIGSLHGARTEPDIPDADRREVYDHLAAHMRDAGMEPPAFGVHRIAATLTASYTIEIPDIPPAEWFEEPSELPPIGAMWVTAEGRIFGLVGPGDTAHRSFRDRRITIPMGNVDYTAWMNRPTIVAGGQRIATGVITMNCGHASPFGPLDPAERMRHYDNSCSIAAVVCIGESKKLGAPWIAGALLPMDAEQVQRLMACQLSGDWAPHREKPGFKEFVAALAVPVPGFARATKVRVVDDALVSSAVPIMSWEAYQEAGQRDSLAAAGAPLDTGQLQELSRLRERFGLTPKAQLAATRDRIRTAVGTAPRPAPVPGTFSGARTAPCVPCGQGRASGMGSDRHRSELERTARRIRSLSARDDHGPEPPPSSGHVFHLPGQHPQRDHAGGRGGGMPDEVLSVPFGHLPGDVSVSKPKGMDGEVDLNVAGRTSRMNERERRDFRTMLIDAQYSDDSKAGSDGVYRLQRYQLNETTGKVESEVLAALRPVPGAWITETGKRVSDPDEAPDEEVYPAEFDLMVDEDLKGEFDDQPKVRVKWKDIDPSNLKGIFAAMERVTEATRIDTGNGPTDIFSPRPGAVGLRMKDDDGNATEAIFNRRNYRDIKTAIESVLYGDDEGVDDLTIPREETRSVHTSHGEVEIKFKGRKDASGDWEGSLTLFPTDAPWSVAVDGPHIDEFWNVFDRNGEAAGF